ncbi:MAG: hypothetical protein OXI43_21660 [Candidatus Poribacteria bacterium]|nr:hypothetical protein [Candidatus Poribacteria bacterium]
MLIVVFVMQIGLIVFLIIGFVVVYRKLTERRVTAVYEPFVYYDTKLFREKVVAGYRIRYYYDGIPFGEPSEIIVHQSNEVDREAIKNDITSALSILSKGVMAALGVPRIELSDIQNVINEVLN